jgi:hypothetical protein
MQVAVNYAPSSNTPDPTASPAPAGSIRLYRGFGGKCVDDQGNSSANRTKVIIWTCNSHDKAQQWTYSGGKLKHNGLCLNDQRSGGNGSKVILYTCNGGANETWTHQSNGQYVLKANGGKYCLDACRTYWIRFSVRQDALDPGFHCVPAGLVHPECDADGAGVA